MRPAGEHRGSTTSFRKRSKPQHKSQAVYRAWGGTLSQLPTRSAASHAGSQRSGRHLAAPRAAWLTDPMASRTRFEGAMTALVTPFKNGAVDEAALAQLVEEQIANGIDGLVPCGTTGEASTLSHEEHVHVVKVVVKQVRGRVPV